jgi:molybdopterin-guanine dinucleotide biosynthesis protein A
MGVDKALLEVRGMPMLERVTRTAARVCEELLVVGRAEAPAGWPGDLQAIFLADEVPDFAGPVAGLVRALEYAKAAEPPGAVLLLACDMPLVSAETLAGLLAAHATAAAGESGEVRVTMAVSRETDGTIYAEPTCSIYEPALLPELRDMLRTNRRSLQGLLRWSGVRSYTIPPERAWELLNVNDAASLAEARQMTVKI